MNVLLIGEDVAALRRLALDLSRSGARVTMASDFEALAGLLNVSRPDVIVFDHVEPMDVFILNPRERGYEGPLVLLIEREVPDEMASRLAPHHIMVKPAGLEGLLLEMHRIIAAMALR